MAASIDESTIEKWRDLVDRLSFATKTKKLVWEESSRDGVFLTTIAKNILYFGSDESGSETIYFVRIQDASGKDVEVFNDEDINDNRYPHAYYKAMKAMHVSIARSLNGAEQILDSLLAALPKPNIIQSINPDDDIPF